MDQFESGQLADAEASLRQAIEIDCDQAEWHHQLGLILLETARVAEAIGSFDLAAAADPSSPDYLDAATAACIDCGDFTGAASRLQRLLRLDPNDHSTWARLIEVQADADHHDDAETSFYLAEMQLGCQSALCLVAMAGSLAARQSWSRAKWCLQEAIRLAPELAEARRSLAEVLVATDHFDDAMPLYEQLVRESPVDTSVAIAWSDLLARVGRESESSGVLRRVLDADPANPDVHYRLGVAWAAQGQYQQAAVAFQLVRRLDRSHVQCDRDLAACLLHLGQVGDAKRLLVLATQRLRDAGECELAGETDESLLALGRLLLAAELSAEAIVVLELAETRAESVTADHLRPLARARYLAGDTDGGRRVSRRVLRLEPDCVASTANLALAALHGDRLVEAAAWIRRGVRGHPHDEGLRRIRTRLRIRRVSTLLRRLAGMQRQR
jgi:tetratricopeptide (TPR) repeat protein